VLSSDTSVPDFGGKRRRSLLIVVVKHMAKANWPNDETSPRRLHTDADPGLDAD
jgi:hypothetical protein